LDESGDLGWTFDAPYHSGGSSRFLTLTALHVPATDLHLPKRIVRDLYDRYKWDTKRERKYVDLSVDQRRYFCEQAVKLFVKNSAIRCFSLVIKKENVKPHIREDPNKLYNYGVKLLLLEEIAKCSSAMLCPDARSIKVKSGNSMHDYLKTCLLFDLNSETNLVTKPCDSSSHLNLQFTDFVCGIMNSHFEHGVWDPYKVLAPKVPVKTLYF
jgi:hypothetical protein